MVANNYYLDWVPFSSLPINCQVMEVVEKNAGEFASFFDQPICPSHSPLSYCPLLAHFIARFGYCVRNDGLIILWFELNEKKDDSIHNDYVAKILSYGLKEKLNHRHVFHGSFADRFSGEFKPIKICSFESGECPDNLSLAFPEELWSKIQPVERVSRVLNDNSYIKLINQYVAGKPTEKPAVAKIRESFSKTFNCFFRIKDELRVSQVTANNASIGTFMVLAGVLTPLWQASALKSGNPYDLLSLLIFLIISFLFVSFGVIRLFSFQNGLVKRSRNHDGWLSRISNRFFAEKAPLKRKLTYPLLVSIVFLSSLTSIELPIPFFKNVGVDIKPEFLLGIDEIKDVFREGWAILTVSFIWILGVFICGGIEILVKRMKILKMARYTLGVLHFGNTYTKLVLRIFPEKALFEDVGFDDSIRSLNNFMRHEQLKLLSGSVIITLMLLLATLPAISAVVLELLNGNSSIETTTK